MSELSGQTSVIHLCMVQLKPENKQTENLRSTSIKCKQQGKGPTTFV